MEQSESYLRVLKPLVIGAISGCGAVLFTNPIDLAKTRLNLCGELQKTGTYVRQINGVFDTLVKTAKHDGIRSLQKGIVAALYFQIIMNGIRLGTYENLKVQLTNYVPNLKSKTIMLGVICSGLTGFIGGYLGSPFNLIKTRLMLQSNFLQQGNRYQYNGFLHAIYQIYTTESMSGFLKGSYLFGLRTGIGSAAQLPAFDQSKNLICNQMGITGIYGSMLASGMASLWLCVFICPIDTLSTRYFGQPFDKFGKGLLYPKPVEGIMKIIKIEGFGGLYKGFTALCGRVAPQSFISLVIFSYLTQMTQDY